MNPAESSLLSLITTPALLLRGDQIYFANPMAIDLLGGHIVGQDVRVAIRIPEALAVILGDAGGEARVDGLSVPGSVWKLACHRLADGQRLVLLEDRSVRASVARAHADFVANANHELRTPLASILGYVETLANPAAGDDKETRDKFLATIEHEARRMQALVEDLMSLSRMEATKHEAPSQAVDMVVLIKESVGEQVDAARIRLNIGAQRAIVAGDKGQLAQALRNLIDNALKYGGSDTMVDVSLELSPQGRVLVTIADKGAGIAPEHLPRLTERFYRVDAGRSRAAGGTGLGLAIVKHIVERHRGRLDLSSELGAGTTATIILPSDKNFLSQ